MKNNRIEQQRENDDLETQITKIENVVYGVPKQSRFERQLNTLEERKEKLEEKIKLPQPKKSLTFLKNYQYPNPKLEKMEELIQHIKEYEAKTIALRDKEEGKNYQFYSQHMDCIERMLDSVEAKFLNPEYNDEDFTLNFAPSVSYKRTADDEKKIICDHTGRGMDIAAGVCSVTIALASACLVTALLITIGGGPILACIVAVAVALFLGAIVGMLLGMALGAIGGFFHGLVETSPYSDTLPEDNPYLNNTAFNFKFLEDAYREAIHIAGDERENFASPVREETALTC